jgi:tRNA threonylcarbamoyladenosine biosynthesis protein TsaB
LETSGRAGFVAVALGADLRGVCGLEEPRRQARDLGPAVAALLREQGWRPRDVQAVLVGRGPGSYTGLRVGIASAKAFAYATGCPVVALDTFAVIAAQSPAGVDRVDVLADAQQDNVYVQPFARAEDGWHALAPLAIQPLRAWLSEREGGARVTGPGLHRHGPRVPAGAAVDAGCWDAGPKAMLRLGLRLYLAGDPTDAWSLEPLYLRPSSAEQQWDARAPRP